MVVAGFPHGPCIDAECPYYDAEAEAEFDRAYEADMAAKRAEMLGLLHTCPRCKEARAFVGDDKAEEIVFHLLHVLKPKAIVRWFHIWVPALKSTPVAALLNGRVDEVLAVVRSYEDPSFA